MLLSGACGTTLAGPQSWIDLPLDNSTLSLGKLNIIVHASDAEGVASFEFYVNDQMILSAETLEHKRLESMQIEWTPPGLGEYMIGVRGINMTGTAGTLATSLIRITGEEALPAPLPEPQSIPATATITLTMQPTVTLTPEVPSLTSVVAIMNANCREGPGTAYEVYGNLIKGEKAVIHGRLADSSWLLIALVGRSSNCWVAASTVDVVGDLGEIEVVSAPAQPNPPPVDVPPPASVDTTPPAIFGAATDKSSMCASDTIRSNVVAVDEGGIDYVYAEWNIINNSGTVVESGTVNYVPIPSQPGGYTGVFGPFSHSGTLNINSVVVDKSGNSTSFSHSVPIDCS